MSEIEKIIIMSKLILNIYNIIINKDTHEY